MRFGRATPGNRAAGLVDDDRLAAGDAAQRAEESAPFLQPLDISDNDLRVLVCSEIVEILVELNVGLITNPDIGAEADIPVGFRFGNEGQRHVAGLREKPNPAFPQIRKTDDVAGPVGIEDAGGIGPDDANATGPGDFDHLLLKLTALFSSLREAAGQDHGTLDALRSAARNDLGERLRGRADESKIHGARDIDNVRIASKPK